MADTMHFDLVSPEHRLASGQALAVRIPGTEGDMTAMPNHAPVITSLRPGLVIVEMDGETHEYAVTGGFAEISAESVSILAEETLPKSEVTVEFLNERIRKAHEAKQAATGSAADSAAKFLGDLVALGDHIGLTGTERPT